MKIALIIVTFVASTFSLAARASQRVRVSQTPASTPSSVVEPLAVLEKLSGSLSMNLKPGKMDVSQFCRVNGYRDYDEQVHQQGASWVDRNPWLGALAPSLQSRLNLYSKISDMSKTTALKARPFNATEIASCKQEVAALLAKPMQQANQANATGLQAAYFCKDVTMLHLGTCTNLVPILMNKIKPVNDTNLIELWYQVLSEPVYVNVLVKVVKKNVDLIDRQSAPTTRFFDDLKTEFLKELKDPSAATEAAFNLIAVLSSNGNNTAGYVPCAAAGDSGFNELAMLEELSNTLLDRRTAQNGFLYTYPAEVDSNCDYGKGYHFWMSAYLAREGAKLTKDPVGAAAAAFTLNKGYQFLKEGNGRDRNAFMHQNEFSNYNNNMRLDLTQAAAGAWFGATSLNANAPKLSREEFENGLRAGFEGVKESPRDFSFQFPDSSDPLQLIPIYTRWKATIHPDGAFEYYQHVYGH